LYRLAEHLHGKTIQNINSTLVGGGVAEILTRMVPLLERLGINAGWAAIRGDDRFFNITKKIHNALHGVPVDIGGDDLEYFLQVNRQGTKELDLDANIIFVHDPQPVALVEMKNVLGNKWAWRCHIDFTEPQSATIGFLKTYIEKYDCAVFSAPAFSMDIKIPQMLISPSIDPLSDKNREITTREIDSVLGQFNIDQSRPIVTQISRFDYLKDPAGVIEVYHKVKRHIDCQLVLAGGGATDDPEGKEVLDEVIGAAAGDPDIHVIYLPPGSDIQINALQRVSAVVLQKSLREGFGLTVAEALWKAKPVIASAVGGIPLQIAHKYSGILTHSIDGTVHYLKQLLNEPEYAKRLGINGRERIKNNFLITRHIRDYLLMFLSLYHDQDIVHLL
jgi:trehalose synthase